MQAIYPGFRYGPTGGGSVSRPTVSSGASGLAPAGGMNLDQLNNYINNLNLASTRAAENARIPMADQLEQQSSQNILDESQGKVSADVMRLLQQQGAERAAGTGVGFDSPNAQAAYLRALGLTSMGLQEQGQRDLTAAFGRHKPAPTFDPTTQLVTPAEQQRIDLARQAEMDRTAYEMASLNHGGGGRGGGAGPTGEIGYPSTRTTTSPITGSSILGPAQFNTNDWWASIGFNPQTATTSSPGGSAIDSYEGLFDPANYEQGGPLANPDNLAPATGLEALGDETLYGGFNA